ISISISQILIRAYSILLSQPKLICKGLELLGMEDCKLVQTPLSPGINLIAASKEEKEAFQKLKINYRSHTGLLNFLACRTRPDLAPAVSILSSFNNDLGIKHWVQVLHCWKYLKGTIDLKLTLRPECVGNEVKYFTDATWADDLESRLSQSGSICFWKTCLIEKIKNFGSNSKTKHHDIKMKWLRELNNGNQINVKLIPSDEMVADALTKPSNAESLRRLQARCFLVLFSPN
ncbi:hypothetical protein VP01_5010g1, partial [Puccinia sorghi]